MRDGLCCEERRRKIIEFLIANKSSTRETLAREFHVSKRTITRDIIYITSKAPIFTKSGNQGGIYILPGYKYNRYLTDVEVDCLRELKKEVQEEKKKILDGIISRLA